MVKAIYLFHRGPGLSLEAFQGNWRTTHADLVRKIGGVIRYTQCQTLLSGYRRLAPPALDGVEEICFDSLEAWMSM